MWPEGYNKPGICDTKVFYASPGTVLTDSWQTWNKPSGITMVFITIIGSGGGGGKGAGGADTTAPGGGACGGITHLLFPSFVLPNTLYIRPGQGGIGASVFGNGATGTNTYVSVAPLTTTENVILNQNGGGGGTTTGGSSVGGAVFGPLSGLAVWSTKQSGSGTIGANPLAPDTPVYGVWVEAKRKQ